MRLPTFQDIATDANEMAIYNLPLRGKFLITGPPGSGKTIMALYRARHLQERGEGNGMALVVYNKTLNRYVSDAAKVLDITGKISTWHSWFYRFYKDALGARYPQSIDNCYQPDWGQVARMLTQERARRHRCKHLLIDEAQDLHPDFFSLLYRFAENTTIFADMNQQIRENQNALLKDIRTALEDEKDYQERTLTRNYRNTKEIAAVADRFYAGMPTGRCDPPARSGPVPLVTSCQSLEAAIEKIAGHARTHKKRSIGVVVRTHDRREKYFRGLSRTLGTRVQTYARGEDASKLRFTDNNITVICLASVKGLEFDSVYLDLPYQAGPLTDIQMMELYVATSRPREHLEFLHEGETPGWITANLDGVVRFSSTAVGKQPDTAIF